MPSVADFPFVLENVVASVEAILTDVIISLGVVMLVVAKGVMVVVLTLEEVGGGGPGAGVGEEDTFESPSS